MTTTHSDPKILESFLWGLLSAVSLNIGSFVGVTCLPRKKVRAMLMSFGGGSLLFALSIELFGHVLSRSEVDQENGPVWIMEGCAILGGILFALLNKALNAHGADVRKPSTTKGRFMRLRGVLMRRLAFRLWTIPFFSELTLVELKELIQSAMNKERYRTGDIILSHETRDSGIFFILSGMVRLYVSEQDGGMPTSPQAVRELRDAEMAAHNFVMPKRNALDVPTVPDPFKVTPLALSAERSKCWDLGPDKVFGDMSVLAGTHVGVTAIALESTKVLVLPCHEVMHLVDRNEKVRNHVSLQALQNLRQLEAFKAVPQSAISCMRGLTSVETFQPGEVVFEGVVSENTPVMSVIFGVVEVTFHHDRTRKTVYGSSLLCTEHFRGTMCQAFTATAVEATSVLVIQRQDLEQALSQATGGVRTADGLAAAPGGQAADEAAGPGLGARPGSATVVSVPPAALQGDGRQHIHAPPGGPSVFQVLPMTPNLLSEEVIGPSRKDAVITVHQPPPLPGQAGPPRSVVGDEKALLGLGHGKPMMAWGQSPAADHPATGSLAALGRRLGWEPEEEDPVPHHQERAQLLFQGGDDTAMEDIVGLVTDQDLEEREQDIAELRAELNMVRSTSKGSSRSYRDRAALGNSPSHVRSEVRGEGAGSARILPRLQGVRSMSKNSSRSNKESNSNGATEADSPAHSGGGAHAAIMVWLGILIDAVPESLVIGILINKSASADSGTSSAEAVLPFVIGVFLSNLPESMSSSGSMKAHGIQVRNILLMWWTITFLTALGASIGAVLFPPGSEDDPSTKMVVSGVEGLAAGAMLTMIAQTMLPEAFEQGGDVVGLSCLAGFLCALSVKLIPFSSGGH